MAITWLWKARDNHEPSTSPAINDQVVEIREATLCLRNPMVTNAAVSARLLSGFTLGLVIFFSYLIWETLNILGEWHMMFLISLAIPVPLFLMLLHNIAIIKNQTDFFFNRSTGRVYYRKRKLVHIGKWTDVEAGMYSGVEFNGVSITRHYALLLKVFGQEEGSEQQRLIKKCWLPVYCIPIDSNQTSNPSTVYIAEVWEFIRHFMNKGADKLSIPTEPHWWHLPQNSIFLTPSQALRHYVPWRTGEPGEHQGKKWWTLPFFLILFPYNMFLALSWWATCRLFNVRIGEPPAEAFETRSHRRSAKQRACQASSDKA